MLRNAWIIPLLPALSFVAILLFGKRLPRKGAELAVTSVGTSFVLACLTLVQWIKRVDDAPAHGALRGFGRALLPTQEGGVAAVERSITWWQNGSVKFGA